MEVQKRLAELYDEQNMYLNKYIFVYVTYKIGIKNFMEGVLFEVGFYAEYETNHAYFIFPFILMN